VCVFGYPVSADFSRNRTDAVKSTVPEALQ
jgi:hypothetical protein